jgi:hypothetical protein
MGKVYADSTINISQEDVFELPEGFDVSFLNCEEDREYEGTAASEDIVDKPIWDDYEDIE